MQPFYFIILNCSWESTHVLSPSVVQNILLLQINLLWSSTGFFRIESNLPAFDYSLTEFMRWALVNKHRVISISKLTKIWSLSWIALVPFQQRLDLLLRLQNLCFSRLWDALWKVQTKARNSLNSKHFSHLSFWELGQNKASIDSIGLPTCRDNLVRYHVEVLIMNKEYLETLVLRHLGVVLARVLLGWFRYLFFL